MKSRKARKPGSPERLFRSWRKWAETHGVAPLENMALATATADGKPSLRMVLLKEFSEEGFVFYTNYESRKGQELAENPRAALLFHWSPPQGYPIPSENDRQVRVEGLVKRLAPEASDRYFATRERGSQLGAWASPQSREIPNRAYLYKRAAGFTRDFSGREVARPSHWGGYLLIPSRYEFWRCGLNRLHERTVFERGASGWVRKTLAP